MQKIIIILSVFILIVSCSEKVTGIRPQDPNDMEWTRDESPIYIEGKFTVPEGETLNIEAGTIIKFQSVDDPNDNFIDRVGWIHIVGNINAIGSEEHQIQFKKESSGSWGGLKFDNSTNNILSNCTFDDCAYVKEENNPNEILLAAIHSINSEFEIVECNFNDSRFYSVYADSTSKINIENSNFSTHEIFQHPTSNLFIEGNSELFIENSNIAGTAYGIFLFQSGSTTIKKSVFNTNGRSVHATDAYDLSIMNNEFQKGLFLYSGENTYKILNNRFIQSNIAIETFLCADYVIQGNLFVDCGIAVKAQASLYPVEIYNSTFINNNLCFYGEDIEIYNSIIYGENSYYQQQDDYLGRLMVHNSLVPFIDENTSSTDCILSNNPMFSESDYSLEPNSPCVDYGINYPEIILENDLNGNLRVCGDSIDLGSFELCN